MLPTQEHIIAAQFIWGTAFKKVPRGRKVCLSQFAFYLCILIFPTLNLLTISSQVIMMSKENELQNDISSLNLCNNSAWKALWRLCSIHFVCYAVFYWLTQEARSSIDKRQTLWMWTHSLSHISHILCFDFPSNYSFHARKNKSHSPIFIYWKWTVFKCGINPMPIPKLAITFQEVEFKSGIGIYGGEKWKWLMQWGARH